MRIVLDIPTAGVAPKRVAEAFARALESVVEQNLADMRFAAAHGHPFPSLYSTQLRFRQEPFTDGEHFDRAIVCLKRGWLDCDDATAWRVAELRYHGEQATVTIYWNPRTRKFHARVRRADGSTEDPSLVLLRQEKGPHVFR